MIDKDFFLERFQFAARMINSWTRQFGKERAEIMIRESLIDPDSWTDYARAAFKTAFGG